MVFYYFHRFLTSPSFSFKRAPVSILLSVTLGLIFTEVLRSNTVPAIPKDITTSGLDLEGAYFDLHQITRQPHAINSHANDLVRAYILDKLRDIADGHPHVSIVDDNVSNASYVSYKRGVSFEGSNILVKIEGTEPEFANRGGVLLSAHFDSVSTGPGVTDDAIGVATLIALVKYLASQRTRRTAVFNINNGEEDGLNGAHAFLQHPWARIPDTFINLEGAAAGGRPLLFRGSSATPARSFKNPAISHPHGNVLSADAFATGIIKSNTDYAIYSVGTALGDGDDDDNTAVKPMEGIDFAFYQGRSKYHTKYDSIAGANGAKESLWLMMDTVRGAAVSLLNDDELHEKDGKGPPPVYFDVLGSIFVVFTQQTLLAYNLVLLFLGPILLFLVYHLPYLLTRSEDNKTSSPAGSTSHRLGSIWNNITEFRWTKPIWWREQWSSRRATFSQDAKLAWTWGKFWVMFMVGIVLNAALVTSFIKVNPFIVYSRPYAVLASFLSLSFLNAVVILNAPAAPGGSPRPDQQKLTVMLQLYSLSWLFLVGSTTLLHRANVGGFYFISAWNGVLFLGCLSSLIVRFFERRKKSEDSNGGVIVGVEEPAQSTSGAANDAQDEDVTERTPLLHENGSRLSIMEERSKQHDESEAGGSWWWILQLLLIVPAPVLLVSQVVVLLIDALYQTLSDGGPAVIVYAPMSLLSFILVLMVTPFTVKTHTFLTSIIALTFGISTLFCLTTFPFSQDAPLVIFFQQNVTVDLTNPLAPPQTLTTLSGVSQFLESRIIPSIPSSWGKDIQCSDTQFPRSGLRSCSWSSDLHPSPTKYSTAEGAAKWITASAKRLSPNSMLISVKGVNTRSCRVFFDTPIVDFIVHETLEDGSSVRSNQPRQENWSIPDEGVKSLWMTSRTWDKEFVVEVMWDTSAAVDKVGSGTGGAKLFDGREYPPFSGLVGCAWAEYESATIGLGLPENSTGIIPAYEEVLTYLPRWAVSTKLLEALVTVTGKFEV